MTLAIETQASSSLTANGLAKLTLAAGKVFEFIVSNASASATFTVDFSLCSSTLGGKYLDCSITPNDKEVLSYDANAGKWKPRSMNGISYQGVWDATGSLPSTTTEGDFYIVSVASGSYAVGDWIVYNGTNFEKISNSNTVVSVYGRTGAVTATEGDYVLAKMGDVDFTATPTTNQVLQFNGTNWVGATLSTVETDPNVKTFAKTTLPTCGSSEVLKGDGSSLACVTVSSGSGTPFSGTASRAMVTDGSGALVVSSVTSTELGYLSGVTSAIQTQISAFQTYAKTPIPTCNAGEVLKSNGTTFSCVTDNTGSGAFSGTASRAVVTDGTGVLASSAVTSTEVGYLSGVTSSIQTQFTNVAATAAAINTTSTSLTSGNIFVGSAGNVATSVAMSGDATIANTGALTIAANSVALSTDTTGNYVLNLTASNGLQATAAAGEGTTPNLVLGGTLTGATTFTQGTNNVLFDLTSTGTFSVLAGANGLSVSNLGVTTLSSAVLTTADINGGTLDDVTIGATTRSSAAVTTLSATSVAIAGTASVGTLLTSTILGGTTTTSGLTLKTTSGVGTTTADMHFLVGNNGGTEAMTILNSGYVGVGIATPVSKLEVNGGVKIADDAATCDSTKAGTFKWDGANAYMCNGANWSRLKFYSGGTSSSDAGLSCKSILDDGLSTGSGLYWIDPDQGSHANAFQAYCDMSTEGGGWTMVYANQFTNDEGGPTTAEINSVYGTAGINSDHSLNGPSFFTSIGATEMLVYDDSTWARFSGLTSTIFAGIFNSLDYTLMIKTSTYTVMTRGNSYHAHTNGVVQFSNGSANSGTVFEFNNLTGTRDTNHYWHVWTTGGGTYAALDGVTGNRWGGILIR